MRAKSMKYVKKSLNSCPESNPQDKLKLKIFFRAAQSATSNILF